jgi:hypothetical protein
LARCARDVGGRAAVARQLALCIPHRQAVDLDPARRLAGLAQRGQLQVAKRLAARQGAFQRGAVRCGHALQQGVPVLAWRQRQIAGQAALHAEQAPVAVAFPQQVVGGAGEIQAAPHVPVARLHSAAQPQADQRNGGHHQLVLQRLRTQLGQGDGQHQAAVEQHHRQHGATQPKAQSHAQEGCQQQQRNQRRLLAHIEHGRNTKHQQQGQQHEPGDLQHGQAARQSVAGTPGTGAAPAALCQVEAQARPDTHHQQGCQHEDAHAVAHQPGDQHLRPLGRGNRARQQQMQAARQRRQHTDGQGCRQEQQAVTRTAQVPGIAHVAAQRQQHQRIGQHQGIPVIKPPEHGHGQQGRQWLWTAGEVQKRDQQIGGQLQPDTGPAQQQQAAKAQAGRQIPEAGAAQDVE